MKYIVASFLYCVMFIFVVHFSLGMIMRHHSSAQPLRILSAESNQGVGLHGLAISPIRQAVFGTTALANTNQPKLIFMGASSVVRGFRLEDWKQLAPDLDVHNAAMPGATTQGMLSLWAHIQRSMPIHLVNQSVIVLGVMYGLFTDVRPDYVAKEDIRLAPLYWLKADVWGKEHFWNSIKLQTYRYFALDASARELFSKILKTDRYIPRYSDGTEEPTTQPHIDALTEWAQNMGNANMINPVRYDELESLIKKIRQFGFKIMVVNMPLPSWHIQGSPYDKPFCDKLNRLMDRLVTADKGIYYIDLHRRSPDNDFYDSTHPKREAARKWSKWLQQALADRSLIPPVRVS